jgi:hypothetical protein
MESISEYPSLEDQSSNTTTTSNITISMAMSATGNNSTTRPAVNMATPYGTMPFYPLPPSHAGTSMMTRGVFIPLDTNPNVPGYGSLGYQCPLADIPSVQNLDCEAIRQIQINNMLTAQPPLKPKKHRVVQWPGITMNRNADGTYEPASPTNSIDGNDDRFDRGDADETSVCDVIEPPVQSTFQPRVQPVPQHQQQVFQPEPMVGVFTGSGIPNTRPPQPPPPPPPPPLYSMATGQWEPTPQILGPGDPSMAGMSSDIPMLAPESGIDLDSTMSIDTTAWNQILSTDMLDYNFAFHLGTDWTSAAGEAQNNGFTR